MNSLPPGKDDLSEKNDQSRVVWWLIIICVSLVIVIPLLLPRPAKPVSQNANPSDATKAGQHPDDFTANPKIFRPRAATRTSEPKKTAQEIVAEKVRQFGQSRRAIAERIAGRLKKDLPPRVDAFFKAVDKGDWNEIESRWNDFYQNLGPDLNPYRATVLDAYGVAEQAHKWPPQQLLDYGNSILDSLKPGEVYVGGTDEGRWVPELLNDTSTDPHIIVTQNAFADGSYLDFVKELYGDQFNTLTSQDTQNAFQQYVTDAQKRLQHDLDYPDEPKQVLPGENVTMVDGKVQISGQVAVMGINQVLLQMLMQMNPDLSFAMQESFPLQNTYPNALPDGPLMQLNAQSDQTPFTADTAQQSVDYWRSTAQALQADPAAAGSDTTLKAYSHNINSTANLLAANNFTDQAEQAYTLASQLYPGNADSVNGLAQLLTQAGHADQAQTLIDQFVSKYPNQKSAIQQPHLWVAGTPPPPAH